MRADQRPGGTPKAMLRNMPTKQYNGLARLSAVCRPSAAFPSGIPPWYVAPFSTFAFRPVHAERVGDERENRFCRISLITP